MGRKCSSNQEWNNDICWCECKKQNICEKDKIWNPAKYLANIMDNSVIMCDEIIDADDEETKSIPKNFVKKK